MSTMTGILRRTILSGVIGTLVAIGAAGVARADVASDKPGAILVFPKIIVDTSGLLFGERIDTEIQITNTSNSVISAQCFLVNATSHCSTDPNKACTDESAASDNTELRCPSNGTCVPQWTENDFEMTLTKRQPISWRASEGLNDFPCDGITAPNCPNGQSNRGSNSSPSAIRGVQEDPFVGELKCVEVDPANFNPSTGFDPANNLTGDLKGEATIITLATLTEAAPGKIDVRKYNGIAIQSTGSNDGNETLQIGGPGAEYNACPNVLILNHFFDDATIVTHGNTLSDKVTTHLTVIPCSEDFKIQENNPGGAVLQFLVFNEFEQRMSTSTHFECFREVPLSDIDTDPGLAGNPQSIFNVGVQGTLAGQSRIRPVATIGRDNKVLGVAEEFWNCTSGPGGKCTTGANIQFVPAGRTDDGGFVGNGDQLILQKSF